MKKILVAIGYGGFAPQYYGYAQQLAHYFGASIALVHIYSTPSIAFSEQEDDTIADLPEVKADQYHNAELDRLKKFSSEYGLMEFDHIKVKCKVIAGDIHLALAEFADDNEFDLLLMGMRKHRLKDHLLGNIVQKILDNVDLPTLLLPPLSDIRMVQNITYATALQLGTLSTVEYLLDWCLAFNCKLTLAHVTAVDNSKNAKANLKSLCDDFHKEKAAGVLSTKLLFGDVQSAIHDYVGRANSDILVIHKRKRGFWSSIMSENLSLELTEKLNIPLLVLSNTAESKNSRLN